MKTETEAWQCWCPMVKGVNGCTHTFAGGLENIPNTCIGSKCMMWRWGQEKSELGGMQRAMRSTGVTWSCAHCDALGKHASFVNSDNPEGYCPECEGEGHGFHYEPAGFCGLAGGAA